MKMKMKFFNLITKTSEANIDLLQLQLHFLNLAVIKYIWRFIFLNLKMLADSEDVEKNYRIHCSN